MFSGYRSCSIHHGLALALVFFRFLRRRTSALGGAASPCRVENIAEHIQGRGHFLLECAGGKLVQLILWMLYAGTCAACMAARRSTGLRWLLLYYAADFEAPGILTILLSSAGKQLAVTFPTLHCIFFCQHSLHARRCRVPGSFTISSFLAAVTLVHNPANTTSQRRRSSYHAW